MRLKKLAVIISILFLATCAVASALGEEFSVDQKLALWYTIREDLDALVTSSSAKRQLVTTYNTLRAIFRQPPVTSFAEIDRDWFQEAELALWREAADKQPITLQRENQNSEESTLDAQKKAQTDYDFYQEATELLEYLQSKSSQLNQFAKSEIKAQLLTAYNALRSSLGLNTADKLACIDETWLKRQDFVLWKAYFTSFIPGADRSALIFNLFLNLDKWLADPVTDVKQVEREVLNHYNYLRELYNQPCITALNQLNYAWLEKAKIAYAFVGYTKATYAQQEMVRHIQKTSVLKDAVVVMASNNFEEAHAWYLKHMPGWYALVLNKNLDLASRLFTAYHELAHVAYNDGLASDQIMHGTQEPANFLGDPNFKIPVAHVNRYRELGKKAIDTSSKLGRRVNQLLKNHPYLWISPQDSYLKLQLLYAMGKEKRADLFALEELYKHHKTDVILNEINYYGDGRRIPAYEIGEHPAVVNHKKYPDMRLDHPSDLDRVLYMSGFLVDKGIDINAALRGWERNGTCIDAEQYYLNYYLNE